MQTEHSNEVDLIRQTLAGDTAAFDQLVKIYRTTIYMLVLSYIKNPADADDLTQRIFIRAYERLATLRDPNSFLPWLQRIAQNTCKNWIRRQADSTTQFETLNGTDFAETAPSPEEIALKAEIETVVREAIGALTETDRKLMQARYIEGASYDQLQVESGLSYAAIANRLKRAKQQIRRRIEKLLGGMVILPGRTLIFGGIEAVKLSAKTKLAATGVAAVLAIGGVMYHHSYESNPVSEYRSVVVNTPEGQEARAVPSNSSTGTGARTATTVHTNAPTDEAADKANRPSTDRTVADGAPPKDFPIVHVESSGGDTMTFSVDSGFGGFDNKQGDLYLKSSDGDTITLSLDGGEFDHKLGNLILVTSDGLRKKIESGEVELRFHNKSTTAETPSGSTEFSPQPTDSVLSPSDPTVESTTTPTEPSDPTPQLSDEDWAAFEQLISDFSDEDWAEFERLLRAGVEAESPQQNKQRSLTPKGQRSQQVIEKVGEKTPITPSVLQKLRGQQRVQVQGEPKSPPRPKNADLREKR